MDEVRVMLVEDDDEHAELVRFVLSRSHPHALLVRHGAGDVALAELATSETLPALLVLDLKLPGISGIDLLHELRGHAATRTLPIVMFSTSNSERDRRRALEAQANAFVVKPMGFRELQERLDATFRFWLDHALASNPG